MAHPIAARPPRRSLLSALVLLLPLAVGGCGLYDVVVGKDKDKFTVKDIPAPKEVAMPAPADSKLELVITASPLVNPDLDNRASPVVARFYQLSSQDAFQGADFSALYETDEKTLGKSMLGRLELILEPGGVKSVVTKVAPDTAFIGVVAAYRRYDVAKWRAVYPVQGEKHTKIRTELLRLSVGMREEE